MRLVKKALIKMLQKPAKPPKMRSLPHIVIPAEDTKLIHASHNVYKIGNSGYFKECKKDEKGRYFTGDMNKIMAVESLGRLLGLEKKIPHSYYCIADVDDRKNILGVFQETSPGVAIWGVPTAKRLEMTTPEFQRAINNIRLFDVICHEADHSINNYYPVIDENGKFSDVSIFDNGGDGSFGLSTSISYSTYVKCDALFLPDGSVNHKYIDKEMYNAICSLSLKDVFKALRRHLRVGPVISTWIRIKKVIKSIRSDSEQGKVLLLEPDMWNEDTIREELSGKYGNTYFRAFYVYWDGDAETLNEYLQKRS